MPIKTENRNTFDKFIKSHVLAVKGGYIPSDWSLFFNTVQNAKRELREFLGGKRKILNIEAGTPCMQIPVQDEMMYRGVIQSLVPDYYQNGGYNGNYYQEPIVKGIKFSKHFLTYLKEKRKQKLEDYKLRFLENLVSEMCEKYSQLGSMGKLDKFNVYISTEAKLFPFFGCEGVHDGSCWKHTTTRRVEQTYKYMMGMLPKTAVLWIYNGTKPIYYGKNKNIFARGLIHFSDKFDAILVSNWYEKTGNINTFQQQEIVKQIGNAFWGTKPAEFYLLSGSFYLEQTCYLQGGNLGDGMVLKKEPSALSESFNLNNKRSYKSKEFDEMFTSLNQYRNPKDLSFVS